MTAPAPTLLYHKASSSDLPASQRYEHWLMPLLSNFEADPPNARQRQDFQGRVHSLMLGDRELHDAQLDDFEGAHSRRGTGQQGHDKLALIYVVQGSIKGQYERDTDTVTDQGRFFLFDGTRPNRLYFHQSRFIQINVPRAGLQDLIPRGVALSQLHDALSCSALAGLLGGQLAQFRALSGRLTEQERYSYLEASEALAVSVLENVLTGHYSHERRQGLCVAAQRYVRQHFSSADLNGHTISAALGCSRATLYRALAEQETSLADQIRELRLQKLARLLQNPYQAASIADLAHRCGLQDAPNLSRMFRQRFGTSPQEYRAVHRASAPA